MPSKPLLALQRLPAQALLMSLLTTAFVPAGRADAPSPQLERYHNKNRLLLFFAPSATDTRYLQQSQRFASKEKMAGLKERDLVRFEIFEKGVSRKDGVALSAEDANGLRKRFGLQKGQFKVVLIGKDGHTAYTAASPISPDRLFGLIDAMPMRREEMQQKKISTSAVNSSVNPSVNPTVAQETPAGKAEKGANGPKPDKQYQPEQVVKIQMEALQHNDVPAKDAGIAIVFAFASPENKTVTGPLEHFAQIVRAPAYLPMLNCKSISYDTIVLSENGNVAKQRVRIVTAEGTHISYLFLLSKQTSGPFAGCWMNDGCVRDEDLPTSVGNDA